MGDPLVYSSRMDMFVPRKLLVMSGNVARQKQYFAQRTRSTDCRAWTSRLQERWTGSGRSQAQRFSCKTFVCTPPRAPSNVSQTSERTQRAPRSCAWSSFGQQSLTGRSERSRRPRRAMAMAFQSNRRVQWICPILCVHQMVTVTILNRQCHHRIRLKTRFRLTRRPACPKRTKRLGHPKTAQRKCKTLPFPNLYP